MRWTPLVNAVRLLPPLAILLVVESQAQEVFYRAERSLEPATDVFVAPRALVVDRGCTVWFADPSNSGVWRGRCHESTAIRVSRAGSGPGEFRGPLTIGILDGDTVAIWDPALKRLSLLTRTGEFVRSRTIGIETYVHGRVDGVAQWGDSLLLWTNNFPHGAPRPNEQRSFVWIVDRRGIVVDSLIGMPGPESIVERDDRSQSRIDAPFQRRPFVFFLPDQSILLGNSGNGRFIRIDSRGDTIASFEIALPERRVTEADRRRFIDSARAGMMEEVRRGQFPPEIRAYFARKFDRMLRELPFPATHQRYTLAAVDRERRQLWLQLPGGAEVPERTWWVCDIRTGTVVKRARVPHQGSVAAAAVDPQGRLWTIEYMTDGTANVVRYGPAP